MFPQSQRCVRCITTSGLCCPYCALHGMIWPALSWIITYNLINFGRLWRWWFGCLCHSLVQTRCHPVSISSFSCKEPVYCIALDPQRNYLSAFQTGLCYLLYKIHNFSRKQRALFENWELEVIKNFLSSDSSDYGNALDCWTTLFEAQIRIPEPWDVKTFGINNFWNMFLTLNSLILDLWQNFLTRVFFSKSHPALFLRCMSENPMPIVSYVFIRKKIPVQKEVHWSEHLQSKAFQKLSLDTLATQHSELFVVCQEAPWCCSITAPYFMLLGN